MSPLPQAVVFIGETETLNQMETERAEKTFTFIEGTVKWAIPEPKMGLRYGVSWLPPDGPELTAASEGTPSATR
jgi:hypothetical protein